MNPGPAYEHWQLVVINTFIKRRRQALPLPKLKGVQHENRHR